MKKLLKYLLPVIVFAAFWSCMDRTAQTVSEHGPADMSLEEAVCCSDISAPDTELCLPRQVSVAGIQRLQTSARRTGGMHRNSIGFIKSGKLIHAGLGYFVHRKSIIAHSSLTEPSCRLLCLGRLII